MTLPNQYSEGNQGIQHKFIYAVSWLSTLSGWLAAVMIVAAVVITCQMIFVRSILNLSTIWQTEAVVFLMISATLMGLPYVQLLRGHVNVDLIPILLPAFLRKYLYFLTLVLSVSIVLVMVFYAFEHWHLAYEKNWRSDTVWGIKLWIPYLALPVGFFLLLLQLVADFSAVLVGKDTPFGLEDK
ncbi:C4-dicarboxylate ABC transporter substrate-binding protein [Marinomonas primoryensis]|uniref:TRAP transporter small permease protein n=1 Tax=Marinomonas primoryensis TaxID=178399 RepID=A0A2Z4PP36_9GAMM|nr:TRAP transporter small permease [Marinomonas primoryensis]AWX98813.1 C4-dicarboxylate ABC transporter substrate-binding protein [Marinomonas primoryensis]